MEFKISSLSYIAEEDADEKKIDLTISATSDVVVYFDLNDPKSKESATLCFSKTQLILLRDSLNIIIKNKLVTDEF